MKSSLKFSVATAVAIMAVVPNLALAGDTYFIRTVSLVGATSTVYDKIEDGSTNVVVNLNITGDFDSSEHTYNDNNTVYIDINNNSTFNKDIYGGHVTTNTGAFNDDVMYNYVRINSGGMQNVVGGKADLKSASGNLVEAHGGTILNIIGGQSIRGNATKNNVKFIKALLLEKVSMAPI